MNPICTILMYVASIFHLKYFFIFYYNLSKVKRNLLVGQFLIHCSIGICSALYIHLILGIKVDLKNSLPIHLATSSLASNFSGIHNIIQNSLMNCSQGTRTGTDPTLCRGSTKVLTQDRSLTNEKNMTSRKFLFQFTNKFRLNCTLVHRFVNLEGDVKDNGFTSTTYINLLCSGDVEITKRCFQVRGG